MILKVLLITIAIGFTSSEPNPRFKLTKDRSIGETPSISVIFPDGSSDTLKLKRYHSNEKERISGVDRCNYFGHLANDRTACVGMTGCPGLEDVEFTLMSSKVKGSPLFKWRKDGHVERIIHPYMVNHFRVLK